MVPEEWGQGTVLDFLKLQRGFDLTKSQSCEGCVPVYSSSGIAYFHDEAKVSAPGVVTGRKGAVGPVYFVEQDFWPHDTTLWVSNFKGSDPKYVWYFLQSLKLERLDEASSVPTLNRNNVHRVKCIFPPLPEQKKIAEILSTWDKAIETTEKLLANAEAQKRALMQQLLTGKKRLNGFEGWNWNLVPVGQVAEEYSERNKQLVDLPVISCTKTIGFVNSLEYFNKQVFSEDLSGYKIIRRGQIGYPSNHVEEGSIGIQNLHNVALVSPIYTVFETNPEIDSVFLFRVLKSDAYRQRFAAATNASVDRRGSLRWKAFSKLTVPLPTLDEQREINCVIDIAEDQVRTAAAYLEKLREEKRALVQQLLTGKKRVNSKEA